MNNKQKELLTYMLLLNNNSPFDYIYGNNNDEIDLIYYYGNKNNIKIKNNYNGIPIKTICSSCFENDDKIISVVIENGIEMIF